MARGEGKRVEGREAPEFLEERRGKDIPSCGVEASYVRVCASSSSSSVPRKVRAGGRERGRERTLSGHSLLLGKEALALAAAAELNLDQASFSFLIRLWRHRGWRRGSGFRVCVLSCQN